MATTTRAVLRQLLSEAMGDYESLTASSNGNADGSTIVDTGLRNLDGGRDDDAFEGWYAIVTSGDSDGEIRRVHASRVNTDTITLQEPFSNQILSAVTFELHRVSPTWKHNAISRALEELSVNVPLVIRDETLTVDNLLANQDFETFSTTFTSWTNTGTPTLSQSTSRVMHGTNSASIVASGATEGITQSVTINSDEITNKQLTFGCWVYATVADAVRIRVLWGSSTYESHAFHSGDDQWEHQEINVSVPSTATEVTAVLEVTDTNTGIFDASYMHIHPIFRYTIPATIVRGPHYVTQQWDLKDPDGSYLPIQRGTAPVAGRILRLEGLGVLTQPASDSATTEIGEPYVSIVVAYAAMFLNRMLLANSAQQQRTQYQEDMLMWGQEAASLIGRLSRPKLGAQRSDDLYHIEEDSSGRYLVFDVPR